MPIDKYDEYRKPLTQEELLGMPEAEEMLAAMEREANQPNSNLKRVPNGFRYEGGDFIPNPVVVEHMGIAMQRAEAQFKGWPAMPENVECSERYAGVDPVGKYSDIDMQVAQRTARINSMLESRSPQVQQYARSLLDAAKNNPAVEQITFAMQETAKKHRILTRASKLCLEPAGRDLLHQQSRILETDLAAEQYSKYLQGIEFAAGIRTGPVPREIQDFYAQYLNMPLNMDLIKQAEKLDRTPREVNVEFQNLDHKLQQELFANPKNWGKTPGDIAKDAITAEQVSQTIGPYARETAKRVLDPLFNEAESVDTENHRLNRADNIIVGGKTVREKMYEDYIAAGNQPDTFKDFFDENFKTAANEYVASALMAGERVEAFVPDKNGRIPNEPVQITKTGYEPSPLNPVVLNGWERFWSKMGFYKEKTRAAAEYQSTLDARERVKSTNMVARTSLTSGPTKRVKDMFFRDWVEKNGPLPSSVPHGYSSSRAALPTMAICYMSARGYDIKDIMDPTKLVNERQQVGHEVMNHVKAGDQRWIGEVLFHGQRTIMDQVDRYCRQINIMDNNQLFQPENSFLFNVTLTAFDASQETAHCRAEYQAAAERFAPGNGPNAAKQVDDRANTMSDFFDKAIMALDAYNRLAGGIVDPSMVDSDAIQQVLNFEGARAAYGPRIAANPQAPVSSHSTIKYMGIYGPTYASLAETNEVARLSYRLQDANNQKTFGRELLHGTAQQRMHIELNENDCFQTKFHMDEPTRQEKLDASRHRELQDLARKNEPKPMGGGRAK